MRPRTILVVEDGAEYTDAFRRLALPGRANVELVRAGDADEAQRILAGRSVDAIFIDVVFDRTLPERLRGDLGCLLERYGGDRARAQRHLASHQGFYVAEALAGSIAEGTRVLLAFDFSAEPQRLAALRERLPGLEGVAEGTPISRVLDRLLAAAAISDSI